MTDSSDVVKSLVHEQERHSQAQNNSSLSDTDQTTLATNRGNQAQDTFNAYSDLAGIDTKSTTATQKDWNTTNRSSQNVVDATEQMRDRVQSEEVKPLLPKFVENARQAVLDHQEESQQASANLKGDGIGASLSLAAGVGDMVIDVADIAVTAVDKVTDAIGALGVLGENLQQEAIGNIKDDIAALENAYENKEQIANVILESLEKFPERLADLDPSAIRSLVAVLGEVAIPVGILAKANKVDVSDAPKADMAIADNETGHSALDQDPVVQALREKDRQGVDPNSTVDTSTDNEMIGQDATTDTGIENPEAGHSNDLNIGQNNENYNQRLNQKITQRGIQKEFENEIGFQQAGAITGKRANYLGREQYGDSYTPEWNDDDIVKKGIVPSGQSENVVSRAHNNPSRPQGSYLAPTGNFKNSDGSLKQSNQIQDTLALPPQSQAGSITSYKGDSDKAALLGPVGKNEWSENPDGTQIKITEKTDRKDFYKDTVQTNDDLI
jgi:hypothetical protein